MTDRSHLSIGEVLSLLREEFPDVTISKIRFLESQGLVDPERTPSGYRKFYDHDVERLRWILRQQRENFLPLKVIRGRLSEQPGEPGEDDDPAGIPSVGEAATVGAGEPAWSAGWAQKPGPAPEPSALGTSRRSEPGGEDPDRMAPDPAQALDLGGPAAPRPGRNRPPARPGSTPSLFAGLHRPETAGSATDEAGGDGPARPSGPSGPRTGVAMGEENDTYTAEELAAAAGAETGLVTDLKQYGLIAPHATVAGTPYYEPSAVAVTRAAAEFARHGVEARHLRMWRNAADREADLFQQVVLPLLRQRNPQARRQAADILADLARAGAELRSALVDRAVRDIR